MSIKCQFRNKIFSVLAMLILLSGCFSLINVKKVFAMSNMENEIKLQDMIKDSDMIFYGQFGRIVNVAYADSPFADASALVFKIEKSWKKNEKGDVLIYSMEERHWKEFERLIEIRKQGAKDQKVLIFIKGQTKTTPPKNALVYKLHKGESIVEITDKNKNLLNQLDQNFKGE